MAKPTRTVIDRVTGYADDAASYLRRRRTDRKPFARVYVSGDRGASHGSDTEPGRALFVAAARLIETSRE